MTAPTELVRRPTGSATKIDSLTGLRFFAAFGIVIYHWWIANYGRLRPEVGDLQPLFSTLRLGVDFFFALSGVVLALTYAERVGSRPRTRSVVTYLWARFARIYPIYVVLTLAAGALVWYESHAWGTHPDAPLTFASLAKQVLLVQSWTASDATVTSWAGPAWSLSTEWLAYLVFPGIAFLGWRVRERPWVLMALAVLAVTPMVVSTYEHGSVYLYPYSWILRIGSNFAGGVCVGLLIRHARRTTVWRVKSDVGFLVLTIMAVGWLELAPGPRRDLVVALILPTLFLTALADGHVSRFLGSKWLVLGGELSYALYLVHGPVYGFFAASYHPFGLNDAWFTRAELVVGLTCIPLAWLLMRFIEHPARRWILVRQPRSKLSMELDS